MTFPHRPSDPAAPLTRDDVATLVAIGRGRALPYWSSAAHLQFLERRGLIRTTVLCENNHRVHALTEEGRALVSERLAQSDDPPSRGPSMGRR